MVGRKVLKMAVLKAAKKVGKMVNYWAAWSGIALAVWWDYLWVGRRVAQMVALWVVQ